MIKDFQARQTALDPTRSFIVQAPAGSGKTGLLVYRLLSLLARAKQPQEVLAITFTRKATSEMQQRVQHLLLRAQAGERDDNAFEQAGIDLATQVLQQDNAQQWGLLNSPTQLPILTIDAFCAKLVASMPWLSRLGERPRTTDNANTHYQIAIERLLMEMLGNDQALKDRLQTVLLALDYNYPRVRNLFGSMLAKREQWLRHLLTSNLAEQRAHLETAWQHIADNHLAALNQAMGASTLAQFIEFAQLAASHLCTANNPYAIFLKPIESLSIEHWRALSHLLLVSKGTAMRKTVNKNQGFPTHDKDTKQAFLQLLSQHAHNQELIDLLAQVRTLPNGAFSDQDWQQLLALEQVLKALAARLQLRFRATGECDHSEVAQRANLALQELDNPTDLGLRLDCQLQHILVDEFQDTSHSQVELLKRLTLGWEAHDTPAKTLFLVGDPMQSVYRFREADVSLFLLVADNAKSQVFANIEISPLTLSENFRSNSSMVQWFNQVFAASFPPHNNSTEGAICYSPATSSKAASEQPPVTCLLAYNKSQQAELLVAQVQQAIEELPSSQDKVAILVRYRSHLKEILPALQQANIAYTGLDIQPLRGLQAVIDVLALCTAIVRLDDRVAWLALLRGPWCGLSLTDIKQLLGDLNTSVWHSIKNAQLNTLPTDSQTRLQRFRNIMQQTLEQKQQVSLASLVRWTWLQLGGADTLMGSCMQDINTVIELIGEYEVCGDIASFEELDQALNKLYAQPNQAAPVVVSTMHKSKGLQYHTVILPALSLSSRADDKEVVMWSELPSENQLLLAPMYLKPKPEQGLHYAYLRDLEKRRSAHEMQRLVYVACTRAEQKLVLLGMVKPSKDGLSEITAPSKNTLLATIWQSLESAFQIPVAEPEPTPSDQALSQQLFRLPSDYQAQFDQSVEWHGKLQFNATEQADEIDAQVAHTVFDWAQQVAAGVGVVLHAWLQYNLKTVLNTQVNDALTQRWRAELRAQCVPEQHLNFGVERLTRGVANIQNDASVHFIFADYAIEHNEYVIGFLEQGEIKQRRIDRTFVDNEGVRWIVDYKTTDSKNADLSAFADEQVERHRQQLEQYGQLFSELEQRPIQLAVYFPLLKQLRSWRFTP